MQFRRNFRAFLRLRFDRRRHNKIRFPIHPKQRLQRLRIKMIRMDVAGRHDINKIKPLRRNHAFRHADMRLVGAGVFLRERVGKIRIEQRVPAVPLN